MLLKNDKNKYNILICDSSPVLLRYFSSILVEYNFNVVETKSGDSINILARTNNFDLYIVDLFTLEGKNGIKVCQFLRDYDKTKYVPIIICTAHATSKDILKLKELKITDVLVKPVAKETLLEKVIEIINKNNKH